MENLKDTQRVELSTYIKDVFYRHCPFSDNRVHILGNSNAPCMDMNINFKNNNTKISFLSGTSHFKMSTAESASCEYYIDYEDVKNILDFILHDHEVVSYLNLDLLDEIKMGFDINWSDSSLKGMNCSKIALKMDFNGDVDLRNKYLSFMVNNYREYLEEVPGFIKLREEKLQDLKKYGLVRMNKEDMLNFLSTMSEDDLREMLLYTDNNLLLRYSSNEDEKKLTL